MKNAQLLTDPDRKGFKAICEIEGSGQRFMPYRATKTPCICRVATELELFTELKKLGVWFESTKGMHLLLDNLRNEICTAKNNIAWDECGSAGYMFFKLKEDLL